MKPNFFCPACAVGLETLTHKIGCSQIVQNIYLIEVSGALGNLFKKISYLLKKKFEFDQEPCFSKFWFHFDDSPLRLFYQRGSNFRHWWTDCSLLRAKKSPETKISPFRWEEKRRLIKVSALFLECKATKNRFTSKFGIKLQIDFISPCRTYMMWMSERIHHFLLRSRTLEHNSFKNFNRREHYESSCKKRRFALLSLFWRFRINQTIQLQGYESI